MSATREQIFQALFTLVSSSAAFVTASRTLVSWDALSPSGQMPAIYVRQMKEDSVVTLRLPTVVKMHAEIYIYCATEKHSGPGSTMLNGLIDAVSAALAPDASSGEQTLGGLVSHCRIEGGTIIDEGTLGDVAMALLPVEIIGFPVGPSTGIGGPVATVTVLPNPISVAVLGAQQLAVTLKDANLNVLVGRQITYVSEAPATATVSASGVVSGLNPGTCNIYVVSGGVQATVPLTVTGTFSDPSSIAGLLAWYKADVGVTLGTGVSQWADQSGFGFNVIQATGASQPAYPAGVLNGKPVIRFDGANDALYAQTLPGQRWSAPWTITAVFRLPVLPVSPNQYFLFAFNNGDFKKAAIAIRNNSGAIRYQYDGVNSGGTSYSPASSVGYTPTTAFLKMIVAFNGGDPQDATNYTVRINGVADTAAAWAFNYIDTNGSYNGAFFGAYVANNFVLANLAQMDLAELTWHNRVLFLTEMQNMEAYYASAARWAV